MNGLVSFPQSGSRSVLDRISPVESLARSVSAIASAKEPELRNRGRSEHDDVTTSSSAIQRVQDHEPYGIRQLHITNHLLLTIQSSTPCPASLNRCLDRTIAELRCRFYFHRDLPYRRQCSSRRPELNHQPTRLALCLISYYSSGSSRKEYPCRLPRLPLTRCPSSRRPAVCPARLRLP
jgi:hypothetical protein